MTIEYDDDGVNLNLPHDTDEMNPEDQPSEVQRAMAALGLEYTGSNMRTRATHDELMVTFVDLEKCGAIARLKFELSRDDRLLSLADGVDRLRARVLRYASDEDDEDETEISFRTLPERGDLDACATPGEWRALARELGAAAANVRQTEKVSGDRRLRWIANGIDRYQAAALACAGHVTAARAPAAFLESSTG